MKIAIFYFSGTGNTEKIAKVIENELMQSNIETDVFNITSYSERQKSYNLNSYNAFIFGFPIYAWRAPKVVRDWLKSLEGGKKKCATFFTYGGVNVGSAHYDTMKILEKNNFIVISSSEFLAKHTFNLAGWDFLENRPNQLDFEVARKFVRIFLKKLQEKEFNKVKFKNPNIPDIIFERFEKREKQIPYPTRKGKECSMCRICEENCPTNAMNANRGEANKITCIRCLKCIINCPDNVLEIKDFSQAADYVLKANKLEKSQLENKISKIYF